jgi:hypothetical protein
VKLQEIRIKIMDIQRFISDTIVEFGYKPKLLAKAKDCNIAIDSLYDAVYELEKKLDSLENEKERHDL